MHGGKKRQRPAVKKPLAEIESGNRSACAFARFAVATRNFSPLDIDRRRHFQTTQRDTNYFTAANKAIVETMTRVHWLSKNYVGTAQKVRARQRLNMRAAARLKKPAAWHEEAEKLAAALWEKRTDFRHNAEKTAQEIHPELVKACRELGLTAPKAGTVAKFIAAKMKTAG